MKDLNYDGLKTGWKKYGNSSDIVKKMPYKGYEIEVGKDHRNPKWFTLDVRKNGVSLYATVYGLDSIEKAIKDGKKAIDYELEQLNLFKVGQKVIVKDQNSFWDSREGKIIEINGDEYKVEFKINISAEGAASGKAFSYKETSKFKAKQLKAA